MQLTSPKRASLLRTRLSEAACVLLAAGAPAVAHADPGPAAAPADSAATTQLDSSFLIYGEQNRARVVEPTARITRLFPDGQSLSGQLTLDVITGASPSGAMPSGVETPVQTVTTPSGNVTTTGPIPAGQVPVSPFSDRRIALDGEWQRPLFGFLTNTLGTHFSREKDYQSIGANEKLSIDLMNKLTTVTLGAGYNRDSVFPVGGTRAPLTDGTVIEGTGSDAKRVTSGLAGLSRVITRRWMMSVTASRTKECGYLTEPYKVVSLLDPQSGVTTGQLTENRPSSRNRKDVLTSSVYHLTDDVLYSSWRYYWDDWGVRSHTFDVKYRHELEDDKYIQPHVRFYTQTPARFFEYGLANNAPVPQFATSDDRLGPMRSVTIGATYGFHIEGYPGEFTVRGEYIREFGNGHPPTAIGVQRQFDLFPAVSITTLVIGYSVNL